MADDDQKQNPLAVMHPALAELPNSFQTDGGKKWAGVLAQQLNAHVLGQAITAHANQRHDQLIQNVDGFKRGISDFVHNDPTALPMALSLIPHTVAGITSGHGDEGEWAGATKAISSHISGEVVRSAVQAHANTDRNQALNTLYQYQDYLHPSDHQPLIDYADNMHAMRQADDEASSRNELRVTYNQSNQRAHDFLNELSHPDTGQLSFPDKWAQRMMQNTDLMADAKSSLLHAYARLQRVGEPENPDANAVTDLFSRMTKPTMSPDHPTPAHVIDHVGDKLSASDGAWIAARVGPQPPAVRDENHAISETLQNARSQIGNESAFNRFTSWFLPAYQRATAAGMPFGEILSPEGKNYMLTPERMSRFQPTGDDVIEPAMRGFAMRQVDRAGGTRAYLDAEGAQHIVPAAKMQPSLGDIFSGAWKSAVDLPGAVARGVGDAFKSGVATSDPAAVAQRGFDNAWPVQGENGPNQNPPHSPTMADTMPSNPDDLTLSDGTKVGSVGAQ